MLFPNRVIMPLFPPIPMKARTFVIVFGGLELLLGLTGSSGVAHFAHLGGMVGGFLMIRYWRGQPPFGCRRDGDARPLPGPRHRRVAQPQPQLAASAAGCPAGAIRS